MLIFFLLFVFHLATTQEQGVKVTWQPFDYMYSGILQPITNFVVDSTFSKSSNTYKYTVNFIGTTFTYDTLVNIGIMGLQISPQTEKSIYLVNEHDQRTKTGFTYYLTVNSNNYIKTLKISYLCADEKKLPALSLFKFTDGNKLIYSSTNKGSGYRFSKQSVSWAGVYVINTSSLNTNIDISHLKGFQIQAENSDKILTLGITQRVISSSASEITFWTSKKCKLIYLEYYILFIDKTLIQLNQEYFMDYGTIYGSMDKQQTQINKLELIPKGYIFATNFFFFNLTSGLTQGFDLDAQTKTLTPQMEYAITNLSYFSFKKRGCPVGQPNYYNPLQLCYEVCPYKTFVNTVYKYCLDCNVGCSSCSDKTACLTCNQTQSFRKKNGTKCSCIDGYYQSNQYVCGKCIDGCLKCTDDAGCLTCDSSSGYSLNTNLCVCNQTSLSDEGQCKQCNTFLLGCKSCTDKQTCNSCLNNIYTFIQQSNICVCSIGFTLVDFQCLSCSLDIVGCLECSSTTVCTKCDDSFNLINDICQCPDGTYLDVTQNICKKCDITCQTCIDKTQNSCTSCHSFLIKQQTTCKCQKQNNVSNGTACVECQNLCNSLLCTGSIQSSCETCGCACQNGYYKLNQACIQCNIQNLALSDPSCTCPIGMYADSSNNNNSCLVCHYSCLTCYQSTNQSCTRCRSSDLRTLNNSACPCNPFKMDANDNSALCITLVCDAGYSQTKQGYCAPVCGDGLVAPQQECDDNNQKQGDGCDIKCKTQTNWTCSGNLTTASVCYYNQPLQLKLISIVKDPNSNNLTYVIDIKPNISALQNLNFSEIIDLGLPNNTLLEYTYENGQLKIQAQYFQNLQSLASNITFTPQNSSSPSFLMTPNSTMSYTVQPQNNLAADVYPDDIYKKTDLLQYACLGIVGLSFLTYLVSLYSGKLIGTEMIWIVQLSFIGLIILDYTDPLYNPMRKLIFSNGYSMKFSDVQTKIPNRIQSLGYYNSLINNFNIMIGLEVIIIIISLVFFALGKFSKDDAKKPKYLSYSKLAIGQWMITAVLLSIYQYIVSTCVLVQYPYQQGKILYASYAEAAIFGLIAVSVTILYGLKSKLVFGQYKTFFKQTKIGMYYYFIPIICRITVGFCLGMFNGSSMGGFAAIGILAIQLVITIALRPYLKNKHTIRQCVNLLIGMIIISCYVLFGKLKIMNKSSITLYVPFLVVGLLIIVIVMNIIFLVFEMLQKCKKEKQTKQDNNKKSQQQKINKQHNDQLAIFKQESKKIKASKNKKVSIFKSKVQKSSSPLKSSLLTAPSDIRPLNNKIQQFENSLYPMDDVEAINLDDIKLTPIGNSSNQNQSKQPILQQIQQNIQQLNDSKQYLKHDGSDKELSGQKSKQSNSQQFGLMQQSP